MEPDKPTIEGMVYTDTATRKKFSKDASSYQIQPQMVAAPANETDVIRILEYARKSGTSITCRSGGSGLSGAGIGPGIIVDFKPLMNGIKQLDPEIIAEPGVVLEDFLKEIHTKGLMLPAIPSSSSWCALGGNIGTRATGPRTARYGTIDAFVTSLKFITPRGDVVDTRKKLPDYLEKGLMRIREQYLSDDKARRLFENRPPIAGGYNVPALSRYNDPGDIAAHLMVGSIGTLGVVTEIRLAPIPIRNPRMTYAAFFSRLEEIGDALNRINELHPAAVEYIDGNTLARIQGKLLHNRHKYIAGALLVEFDESDEQVEKGQKILVNSHPESLIPVPVNSPEETRIWEERRLILPRLRAFARKKGWIVPSIIDDVAIHVRDFVPVVRDLNQLMRRLQHDICIFGHIGFGSLHARPLFDPRRKNIAVQIDTVSRQTFQILHQYGGTLVGEHNAGRSRSIYLEMELGDSFSYLRKIKDLFDPEDLLNPNTLFNTAPITENMDLGG
ncbi:MAG: FAD-binding oxidoreductase [Thermodesulfobacteriota bacterium]